MCWSKLPRDLNLTPKTKKQKINNNHACFQNLHVSTSCVVCVLQADTKRWKSDGPTYACVSKQIDGPWRGNKERVRSTHVAQFASSRWRLPAALSTNLTAPTHHVKARVDVPRQHKIKWNDESSHVRTRIFDFYREINGDGRCEEPNCCSMSFERWLDWTHNFEPNSKRTELFSKLVE